MTHLKIEQNNGVIEEVSSAVIDKLYDIVHSGTLDNTSNLIGRLHTSATYQDYIDYLEDTFKVNGVKQLIIDATKKYMSFTDPVVASYWANSSYGDGAGIDSTAANGVLSIPVQAFKNNTSLQTFDELNKFVNCTTIGSEAFRGCTNLTSINLSNVTTFTGEYTFNGCSGLTGILNLPKFNNFGNSDSNATKNSFSLTGLTEINIGTDVQDSNKITFIPQNTFNSSQSLTKITGLSKVTKIKSGGFQKCTALRELDLSSELTTLNGNSFSQCSNLECINITNVSNIYDGEQFMYDWKLIDLATNDVNNINTGAATYTFSWSTVPTRIFAGCLLTNKSFVFTNATSVGTSAFNSTKIVSINIPNVSIIYSEAFNNCKQLTTVTTSNLITTIQSSAFLDCSALTTIDLSNVTTIQSSAFKNCTSLTTVDLSGIQTTANNPYPLGTNAFQGCTSLQSVTLGSGVTTIDNYSFSSCISLTTINTENITLCYNNAFRDSTALTSIDLSSCVTVGDSAFMGCTALTTVKFGSNLTTIQQNAFKNTALTTIQVPTAKLSDYQTAFPDLASKMVAY